jgi:hypothetical protein
MARLVNRRCRLTVSLPVVKDYVSGDTVHGHQDALEINGGDAQGMRVQFSVKKSTEKEPNTADITVSNLAEATREALTAMGKGSLVTLDAGYEETGIVRIFTGDARSVDHARNGSNWDTVFKCGDGERAYRFARWGTSYAANTSASVIVRDLVNQLGLGGSGSNINAVTMTKVFQHGYAVHGPAMRSLDRLLKSMGFSYSIQDGAIQILQDGATAAEDHIPVITSNSGLIGSPEMGTPDKKGAPALLKFTSLLVATKPGKMVRLESQRYKGFVTVKKVEMRGDTHSGDWNSDIYGSSVATERAPELAEVIRQAIESRVAQVNVSLPARVERYDAATQKVDAKPLVMSFYRDETDTRRPESLPIVASVPVAFPQGGGYALTFPLQVGDIGTLVWSQLSLDRWLSGQGQEVDPEIDHLHGLSDGIFFRGCAPSVPHSLACPPTMRF